MKKIACLIVVVLFFSTVLWAQQGRAAFADSPAVLTSVGQSADIEMVRVLLTRSGIPFRANAQIRADGLETGDNTLILVLGGSSKGLGAAGVSVEEDLTRSIALVDRARSMGMQIIAIHVGGNPRRGPLSDGFINFAVPVADYFIFVADGDRDGLLTNLANGANVPLSRVDRVSGAAAPLSAAFR